MLVAGFILGLNSALVLLRQIVSYFSLFAFLLFKESTDQTVKLMSLDMLSLLTDHSQLLLSEFPDLPRVIIEVF